MDRSNVEKSKDFTIVKGFPWGYRNREDITNLPPGVLVKGSQNVLTNVSDRVAIRQGYTLDGGANTSGTNGGILRTYDFERQASTRHLRSYSLGSGNGTLEYRYVDSAGTVTWRTLMSGFANANFNFTNFWDFTTEKTMMCLFVNGTSNVYEWNGAVTTIASVGTNTLTKEGTTTWAQEGFYTAGTRLVTILGVDYTYTGGESTTTLTGVTPDPALAAPPITVGSIAHQKVRTTAASAVSSLPATMAISLISNLRNQIYYGSLVDASVYISVVDNYKSVAFTSPVRVVGEGARVTLSATPVAFVPQESEMYISAGSDQMYQTKFTLSSDLAKESFEIIRLKTGGQQGAQSQQMVTKMKNDWVLITNEPTMDTLGRIANVVLTPQTTNLSDSIKLDFDNYDFTDAQVFYFRYFIYVSIPRELVLRVYNLEKKYWEAPQILPIAAFSIIDGELYGHDYNVPQSYKLFDGYNDNGKAVDARAVFSYQNYGFRTENKSFNEYYAEGYIQTNTTLTIGIMYDIGGCATDTTYTLAGTDTQVVCVPSSDASLGKASLGKHGLGTESVVGSPTDLPPKFRVIKTFTRTPFYEFQPSFSSVGIDQRWELLAFGGAPELTTEGNNDIKD